MSILGTETAATGFLSIWAIGISTYLMRSIPKRLYEFIESRFVVKVTVTAGGLSDTAGLLLLHSFYQWFMKSPNVKRARRFLIEPPSNERNGGNWIKVTGDNNLGPGIGTQLITYKGRIGWFTRGKPVNSDNAISPHELTISFFGRDPIIITQLIEEVKFRVNDDQLQLYTLSTFRGDPDWKLSKVRKKRDINSVITNSANKTEIINNIKKFMSSEKWYEDHGINYKQVFLLHGTPGTGKSSLAFALASFFNKAIYIFNINAVNDTNFMGIINSVPRGCFILFEDIDATTAADKREDEEDDENKPIIQHKKIPTASLSTVLNSLDGVSSVSGVTIFITTNHIEKLDPALIRKGRVDYIYEINPLTDTEVREYISQVFPEAKPHTALFEDITGANLQCLLLEHRDSPEGFVKAIPRKQDIETII